MNKPLFHIVKRGETAWYFNWMVRAIGLVLALICCGVVSSLVTGENPFEIYAAIIDGSFGTSRKIWITMQNTAMLLCIALALTPAFKMRCWNLGGEGQALAGAIASATCMVLMKDMSNSIVIPTMVITSILAGAIWGAIPAFFKAKFNTNETLFTLMLNYVAIQFASYLSILWENPKGSGSIGVINPNSMIGWFPQVGPSKYLLNIIIVAVITVGMYIYLNYSKQGYEIAVVGESERTARYVGIKVERVIIRTMIISGAICGIAGLLLVGGTNHTLNGSIVDGRGFTAVMVSWLGKFNPIWMIFTSFLMVFLGRGAGEIATDFGLNHAFGDILTGIILFFIIGCEFFITYKISFTKKSKQSVPDVEIAEESEVKEDKE